MTKDQKFIKGKGGLLELATRSSLRLENIA